MEARIQRHMLFLFRLFLLVGFGSRVRLGSTCLSLFVPDLPLGSFGLKNIRPRMKPQGSKGICKPFSRSVPLVGFGVRARLGLTCLPFDPRV